jgi:hypothetical protein
MLSLPEDWDYTTKGLAYICKDGVDSICAAVKELENAGYVQRKRNRNSQGRLTNVEYTILEKPISTPEVQQAAKRDKSPKREKPVLDNPVLENPRQDIPEQDLPKQEKPAQLNTNTSNKEKINTDISNTHSFFPSADVTSDCEQTERRITSGDIRAQIEYEIMAQRYRRDQLDELVEIMLEVALNRSPTIHIGRDAEYPTYYVQERFQRINSMHIEKVMDGIAENRTRVYNTKAYLIAALFNSVSTIDHHYAMLYNSENQPYSSL